jgi:hypothetical protein
MVVLGGTCVVCRQREKLGVFPPIRKRPNWIKRAMSIIMRLLCLSLSRTSLPWNTLCFVPNLATPHTAYVVFDFLHDRVGRRAISHWYPTRHGCEQNWPPSNPDVNPRDVFLWDYLQEKLFSRKAASVMELRAIILGMCDEIAPPPWKLWEVQANATQFQKSTCFTKQQSSKEHNYETSYLQNKSNYWALALCTTKRYIFVP